MAGNRGAAALQLLVILVPVLFGLIGFAVDLGMMYSVRGELKAGAGAMALAAAQQLIGTDAATAAAGTALAATSNNYYFHGFPIGKSAGSQVSTISDPAYYATAADAIASGSGGAAAAQSKYVRVTVTGQIPLTFWSFMPLLNGSRNATVAATAVAGISVPLCLACGIEPIALAALNQADTTDFGSTSGVKYSLTFLCTAGASSPAPAPLAGAAQLVSYLLLNRFDPGATLFTDEASQAFQDGAGGLPGSTSNAACPAGRSCACFRVNNTEVIWASAMVASCGAAQVPPVVTASLCGLDARFESSPQNACTAIPSLGALSGIYTPDTDTNDYDTYPDYTGQGRRVITVPIVDSLAAAGSMTVLGFRQFLLIPAQGTSYLNPGDPYGRFVALYIGSVAPIAQGRFDGCQQTAGPGKVVLHQ
jgi:Flp pilus assembly protein TadG